MPKFILLNGPPRSGKDTAAAELVDNLMEGDYCVSHEKFSAPLKEAFAGVMEAQISGFTVKGYEERKEEIIPCLGVSYRQWQIDFSEKFMKPLYGIDVFGRLLWARLEEAIGIGCEGDDWVFVISDCGFQVEVDYLLRQVPNSDVLLLRLRRDGCSFTGDSRGYVTAPSIINIQNESLPAFRKEVREIVAGWLA